MAAIYAYFDRFCSHVLGRSQVGSMRSAINLEAVVKSGLPMVPDGMGRWRCLVVEKLSQVKLRADAWHTEPRSPPQTGGRTVPYRGSEGSG